MNKVLEFITKNVGVILIVLALFSMSELLYFTYTQRVAADCQRGVNREFMETVKARGELFEEDRNSLGDLFASLVQFRDIPGNQEARQAAVDRYFQRQAELDNRLQDFQWPDLERQCN